MMYECPNCHCDNQDMLVGMGDNMMYCEACEHEFHETKVVEKRVTFKEQVYEIAFGDDAINKGYSEQEVLDKLREHSDNAWKYEELSDG